MAKQKRLEQLQRNDTVILTDMFQKHLERKIADGGSSSLTRHDKLVVLQRFLSENNRSPHLRSAIAADLNRTADSPLHTHPIDADSSPCTHKHPADMPSDRILCSGSEMAQDWSSHLGDVSRDMQATARLRRDELVAAATDAVPGARASKWGDDVEILSGKKLRKAQAREVRQADAYEREEENLPLATRVRNPT